MFLLLLVTLITTGDNQFPCMCCTPSQSVMYAKKGLSMETIDSNIRPQGYKTFFMLNSVEHGILNALTDQYIKKFGFFFRLR